MIFSCQISHLQRNVVRRERKGLIAWSNVKEGRFCNIYIIINNLQMSFTIHATDIMLSPFLVSCPLIACHMPCPSCIAPSACHPHPVAVWYHSRQVAVGVSHWRGIAFTVVDQRWHEQSSSSSLDSCWCPSVAVMWGSIDMTWWGHWLALKSGIIVFGWCWGGIIVVLGHCWHSTSVSNCVYSQAALTQAFLVWVEEAKMSDVEGVEVVVFGGGYHQNISTWQPRPIDGPSRDIDG